MLMQEPRTGWARGREFAANGLRIGYGTARGLRHGPGVFGKRPVIQGRVHFRFRGSARIGDQFMCEGTNAGVLIKVAPGGVLTAGQGLYMNAGASIEVFHEVRIGDHVLIAAFASIIDDDRHEVEPGSATYKGPVVVGNNVWIGRNAAVLPGVTIGDNSVIGANSVVSRDVPPGCFAAGAPARVIRKLEIPGGWWRI
jgi:acetyltransferase-like isoleucine patch superfamily enzyme